MIRRPNPQVNLGRNPATDPIYSAILARIHASTSSNRESDERNSLSIGLTSCERHEGVSTISANFARFCSEVLQLDTLLIDSSFGEKHFEKYFELDCDEGLQQVIEGDALLFSAIQSSPVERLDYLSAGFSTSGTFSPIDVAGFDTILKELENRYQLIVIDLPPAGGMATGMPIANKLDAVLLVVQPGKTKKARAASVQQYLNQSGVNVVGALANQADMDLPSPQKAFVEILATVKSLILLPITIVRYLIEQWLQLINGR